MARIGKLDSSYPRRPAFRASGTLSGAILGGIVFATSNLGAAQESLLPDVNLRAVCPSRRSDETVAVVERKMFDYGFDVIDVAALARKRHVQYPFLMRVEALDQAGRELSLTAFDLSHGGDKPSAGALTLHVALYSRPPTPRDPKLKQQIASWTEELGCSVRDTEYNDNGQTSVSIYETTISTVRGWFAEARQMGAKPSLLLTH